MADKRSDVVLDVDLECPKCNKKIRKALCKFYEIQSWSFDEKQKKVIISGSFNPECLIKKLYCKVGCKIIKGHEIPKPPPPLPPKKPEPHIEAPPRAEPPKPKPPEPKPKPPEEPAPVITRPDRPGPSKRTD